MGQTVADSKVGDNPAAGMSGIVCCGVVCSVLCVETGETNSSQFFTVAQPENQDVSCEAVT